MTQLLKAISITDFRSIRGTIAVPLDAPVVLIHGQNGAGKTSLLSAIELGLTGHIPSLRRIDPDYVDHLVHKEASLSRIVVSGTGPDVSPPAGVIDVSRSRVSGQALLSQEKAHFYSERCFLAQSTLGRLLELYEDKDTRKTDSPLTKFVKDLLGLDHLDALIEGLHDAGDVRRFRSTVPAYADTRESIAVIEKRLTQQRLEASSLEKSTLALGQRVLELFSAIGLNGAVASPLAVLTESKEDAADERELQRLARLRRDVSAVGERWRTLDSAIAPAERAAAEAELFAANRELSHWRDSFGPEIERVFATLREFFPDLPSPSATGPDRARTAALAAVTAELQRCASLLAREDEDAKRVAFLDQDISRARARIGVLEQQITDHVAHAGSLAEALSRILPHVQSEHCPVCERDFAEVSTTPLQAHVSARIASLTESAGRLQALSRERASTTGTLASAERERSLISSRQLSPAARDETKTRRARLEEIHQTLTGLVAAKDGERLIEIAASAARRVGDQRSGDQQAMALRDAVSALAAEALAAPLTAEETVEAALARISVHVSHAEGLLTTRQATRREALANAQQLEGLKTRAGLVHNAIRDDELQLQRLSKAKALADSRISDARELVRRVRDARTSIVRRVFNEALNAVWRDLFVRLAPEEPFVPAFALPTDETGPVEATLETHYRSGGKGGNPRAMLSAGNLNTAALTLFLALHLSVEPSIPCLVIDDPIQSMDEVHIAQFAALLRTLAKSHGRQVVIAVHEKPLFEYLALELSPAFQTDRLITIELDRNADGTTVMRYEPHVWQPDTAISA